MKQVINRRLYLLYYIINLETLDRNHTTRRYNGLPLSTYLFDRSCDEIHLERLSWHRHRGLQRVELRQPRHDAPVQACSKIAPSFISQL